MDNTGVVNSRNINSIDWLRIAISLSIISLTIFFIYSAFIFLGNLSKNNGASNTTNNASISGSVDINGQVPNGATVAIVQKKTTDSQFKSAISGISAVDGAVWSWNDSQNGVAYNIKAYLQLNGTNIAQSETITVAAPALNESLRINISGLKGQAFDTLISGMIDLNGYIPANSIITISERKTGESRFTPVVNNLPAIDGIAWSWNKAQSQATYEIQASLVSNGKLIGQSVIQKITAPASNESIRLDSSAKAPVVISNTKTSISGKINQNGVVPANSTYSIGVRKYGSSQFNVVISGIPALDGVVWNWNEAVSGEMYDIQAYLMLNGNMNASSQVLTVPAPATNEILTINAQTRPPQPVNGGITNSCVGKGQNGLWQVKFTYNNNGIISNAQQFVLSVGSSSGNNDLVNNTTNPTNPNQSQTYTTNYLFNEGTTYYAQWAYSTCSSCNVFSLFSPTLTFYCNSQPTNTPTPSTAPTSSPTPTSLPTLLPTPTNTPIITPTQTPTPTEEPTPIPPTNSL